MKVRRKQFSSKPGKRQRKIIFFQGQEKVRGKQIFINVREKLGKENFFKVSCKQIFIKTGETVFIIMILLKYSLFALNIQYTSLIYIKVHNLLQIRERKKNEKKNSGYLYCMGYSH